MFFSINANGNDLLQFYQRFVTQTSLLKRNAAKFQLSSVDVFAKTHIPSFQLFSSNHTPRAIMQPPAIFLQWVRSQHRRWRKCQMKSVRAQVCELWRQLPTGRRRSMMAIWWESSLSCSQIILSVEKKRKKIALKVISTTRKIQSKHKSVLKYFISLDCLVMNDWNQISQTTTVHETTKQILIFLKRFQQYSNVAVVVSNSKKDVSSVFLLHLRM